MLAVAGLSLTAVSAARAVESFVVAVPSDVLADYEQFIGIRDPIALTDFGGPHSRRDVVEVVLLQQALRRGGWQHKLELVGLPTTARLLREVEHGNTLCSATSYWRDDVAPGNVHYSDSVVESGEFEAGLYALASNERAMAAKNLADVRRLTILSNRSWVVDWHTLEQLGIANLQHVGQWDVMPRMVAKGRADLLLAPFQPTPDLSLAVEGVRLVPIPRLKIGLAGTRHFIVSRRHPLGGALLQALNTGLAQLRRKGVVRQAYVQSGFFNPKVADWTRL